MNVMNLTPHTVKLIKKDTEILYPPSGQIARVKEEFEPVKKKTDIPLSKRRFKGVEGLPEKKKDTLYIVSSIVALSCNRGDLIVPVDFVRSEKGEIVGCKGFALY